MTFHVNLKAISIFWSTFFEGISLLIGFVFKGISSIYNLTLKEAPRHAREPQARGHGGMPEGSQDKRIRKPKLEKGNWKGKKKKRKQIQFHRKYWGISTRAVSPKSPRGPAASAFYYLPKKNMRNLKPPKYVREPWYGFRLSLYEPHVRGPVPLPPPSHGVRCISVNCKKLRF